MHKKMKCLETRLRREWTKNLLSFFESFNTFFTGKTKETWVKKALPMARCHLCALKSRFSTVCQCFGKENVLVPILD